MLLFFLAIILIGALFIADPRALAWAAERMQAFRQWMESRS